MGEKDTFKVEQDGHIDWLTLNRPEKRNTIGLRFFEDLTPNIRKGDSGGFKMLKTEKFKSLIFVFCILIMACASTRSKPRVELDGFRGIHWGADVAKLDGMEKVEQVKTSDKDIAWYTRKGETLTFGNARVENIFYSFWMGSFESVSIDFRGTENFKALKNELFERFGKVLESAELLEKEKKTLIESSPIQRGEEEFYFWDGKQMEMWLSYSKESQRGNLSINSKKINEERRSYEKEKEKEEKHKGRKF